MKYTDITSGAFKLIITKSQINNSSQIPYINIFFNFMDIHKNKFFAFKTYNV